MNPVAALYETQNDWYANRMMANAGLIIRPLPGLSIHVSGNARMRNARKDYFRSLNYPHSLGAAKITLGEVVDLTSNNIVTYDKFFGKHHITLMGGLTYESYVSKNVNTGDATNFITDVAEIHSGAFKNIAEGAELHMPLTAPAVYGNDAISRPSAPFPKVFLKGNFEDWFDVMEKKNHLILREDFNNTGWSHKYDNDTKGWAVITGMMAQDDAMCTKVTSGGVTTVTVPDRKVIAFIMRGNNTGCWVLRESSSGTRIMVQ